MSQKSLAGRLLQSTILAGVAVAIAAPASAQETDDDTIVITGSKIPRKDLEGPSPVAVYDEGAIEVSGVTSIGKLLREIPAVAGGAQTTTINNGGGGSEQVSLRGLGSERTLVLVNGRRVPDSSAGLSGQVDLNTIPVALIERVEVLKDGASTVYGADAVAGVVNIILKDDFEGVDLSYQYGVAGEGDGDTHDYSITFGDRGDKGGFVLNLSKTDENEISAGDREFSATAMGILFGEVIPLGSSAPPWGFYTVPSSGTTFTLGPDFTGGTTNGFRQYNGATDSYNFAPINFQKQPINRWSVTAIGDYDIDPLSGGDFFLDTEAFVEFSYIDRESKQQLAEVPLAPFAFFGFNAPYSAQNEFNPFGEDLIDWRRRLVEGGGRTDDVEVQTSRLVGGLRGDLANNWSWELSYAYGDVDRSSAFSPIINLQNVALAVGPTARDTDGTVRCDTNGDGAFDASDDQSCVPLNVFGENSITQDMLDYISITQNESTSASSEIFSFDLVKPDLFQLPGGDAGIALGYVHREEQGRFTPDSQVAALGAAATGTPAQATRGGYELDEFFVEATLPLISGQEGAEELTVDLGFRYSDYDTFGSSDNYKIGVQYRPIDELLLRASFNTAFRAPQINDLFAGQSFSFPGVTDPCATNPTQFCQADGVPAGGFTQISNQVRTLVGGNPNTQPEEADIFTLGAIWTPSQWDGVAFGIDYFSYELDNPITSIGADVILQQCASTGAFCDLIQRITTPGPNLGAPILITNTTTNVGEIETDGFDLFAEWTGIEMPSGGTLNLKWDATVLENYELTQADGSVVQHAGFLRDDQDGLFAEFRWNASASYEQGPWFFSGDVRYISGVSEFGNDLVGSCLDANGEAAIPGVNFGLTCVTTSSAFGDINAGDFHRKIDDIYYLDLYASYELPFEKTESQVYFGINNVTDEEPPFSVDGFNDNTDVRTYDTIGRFFYGGVRVAF